MLLWFPSSSVLCSICFLLHMNSVYCKGSVPFSANLSESEPMSSVAPWTFGVFGLNSFSEPCGEKLQFELLTFGWRNKKTNQEPLQIFIRRPHQTNRLTKKTHCKHLCQKPQELPEVLGPTHETMRGIYIICYS